MHPVHHKIRLSITAKLTHPLQGRTLNEYMYYLNLTLLFIALPSFIYTYLKRHIVYQSILKESNAEFFFLIVLPRTAYHVYMEMLLILGLRNIIVSYILLGSQT